MYPCPRRDAGAAKQASVSSLDRRLLAWPVPAGWPAAHHRSHYRDDNAVCDGWRAMDGHGQGHC